MIKKFCISIVLFNNELQLIENVLDCCAKEVSSEDIYLIDNSTNSKLEILKSSYGTNYLKEQNRGFGAGHNAAFKNFDLLNRYQYTLILNPDIIFEKNTIINLVKFLDKNIEVGALMPKILNFDGSLQYARRCLPTPKHLFYKKFFPSSNCAKEYELKGNEPTKPIQLIAICGCFMLIRNKVLEEVNLFDERFFMYFEDFDLARRISMVSKVIYYPLEKVYHLAQREHRKNFKLFLYLILSAIKYFLKWGIFDNYRDVSNQKLIKKFQKFSL